MKKILKALLVCLLFFYIYPAGEEKPVYGQTCNQVSLKTFYRKSCEDLDPETTNCNVPDSLIEKNQFGCWKEPGSEKCVTIYWWTGCYKESIGGGKYACKWYSSSQFVDCANPPGGGGGGYDWTKCPQNQWLICGSGQEAVDQNKSQCAYGSFCNKYFFPSDYDFPQCKVSPPLYTCKSNCSCCPIGDTRSCTIGSTYVKNITIQDFRLE